MNYEVRIFDPLGHEAHGGRRRCVTSRTGTGPSCTRIWGLSPIAREGIKRDQKDRKQNGQKVSSLAWPFRFFQQVGDCGTQEIHLKGGDETGGNFHQCKLLNQRQEKDRAADHWRSQTQCDRKNVAEPVRFFHFSAWALCSHSANFCEVTRYSARESHFIVAEDAILGAQWYPKRQNPHPTQYPVLRRR